MTFEKYAIILGFVVDVISAAYFFSDGGDDKKKLSGLGAFIGTTLLSVGLILMFKDGFIGGRNPLDESSQDSTSYSSQSVSFDQSTFSDDQDMKEEILYRAKHLSYMDVYPDNVEYQPSCVDIWNTQAGYLLNMRSGPNSSYDLIDQIKNGEEVITLHVGNNDYTYLYYAEADKYGWVLSKYIRVY